MNADNHIIQNYLCILYEKIIFISKNTLYTVFYIMISLSIFKLIINYENFGFKGINFSLCFSFDVHMSSSKRAKCLLYLPKNR